MTTRYAVLLLVSLSSIGCTSMHPMSGTPGSAAEKLTAGELIIVHELSGTKTEMHFSQISNDAIQGKSSDGSGVRSIALAKIKRIEAKRIDGLRTTLLVIASAAALSAFVDALEDAATGALLAGP